MYSADRDVPTLTTERLSLRGPRLADFPSYVALWADPNVVRFIGGRPFSEEEVWGRFLRSIGHWSALGYGFWAVEERASGRVIGELGFARFNREISPSIDAWPEAGWVLSPGTQGQGLATEAMLAALAWHDARTSRGTSVCIIDPGNAASRRVAAKLGYRERAQTSYHGSPTIIHER